MKLSATTLLLISLLVQVDASPSLRHCHRPIGLSAFAGGGFGSSSGTKKTSTKKKDKKKRVGLMLEDLNPETTGKR
jgi:hypothetical protein